MAVAAPARPRGARLRRSLALIWDVREGRIGLVLLGLFLFVVVLGPALAPHPPTKVGVGPPVSGPSFDHLLGTDQLGRDVLSRLLHGARSVIAAPLVASALAFAVGGLTGLVSGYVGGRFDVVTSRVLDVLLALPPLLIVLVVIAALGSSTPVLILSVALVYSPRVARVLRGATQGVASLEFVQAAQARGERTLGIVMHEVLPNISATVLVEFAVRLTYVIIFIATLNFLGLGVQPPSPNWGVMVAESRATILTLPVGTLAPTLAIGTLCVAIGLIADAASQKLEVNVREDALR